MSVEVKSVKKWSPLFFKGVRAGDRLVSINGNGIKDFLDYRFYLGEEKLGIIFERDGKERKVSLRKKAQEDIGLEFDSYLMDKQKSCRNKCIFCFIDQNPKGMRETIYFKDDDSRLSFIFGNYITLTNLTDEDIDRIIKMHISPVNVSVHTMNPELRVKMMKNPRAGECLSMLKRLAEAGISLNTQLVLCPGINDGEELRYSLEKLGELGEAVESIAAVPVGVTKHREGLYPMPEYTKETAAEVIDIINEYGDSFESERGLRLCYASDEFYLKAERPIPDENYYGDYPQIENGVGMWRNLITEFEQALSSDVTTGEITPVSIVTGAAAYPLMVGIADMFREKYPESEITVHKIRNDFFGESVTVAGLVTGGDLINQMKTQKYHKKIIIPSVMLRSEGDLFLDGVSVEDVVRELGVELHVTDGTGEDLVRILIK